MANLNKKIPLKSDPTKKISVSVKTVKPVLVKFAKHSTFDTFSFFFTLHTQFITTFPFDFVPL